MFTPTVIGSGLAGFNFLQRTREQQQSVFEQSPQISRDTQKFVDQLADVQSSEQLMENRDLLRVALGAFGLSDDIDNRAFIQKILDSDLSDSKSLANRLSDKRYLAFAQAFNFASEDGPQLPNPKSADEVAQQLADLQSADDLLNDPVLLRATLTNFGLEDDARNSFFLKSVLESDLSDPDSFVNQLSDPRYVELAEAFGLGEKLSRQDTIYGFADLFAGKASEIRTYDDLAAEPELLDAALRIFGLEEDAARPGFIEAVLNSDLSDPASVANSEDDTRYAALADAFGFAERVADEASGLTFTSKLEGFVDTVASRSTEIASPAEFFADIPLMLDTIEFFDLPRRDDRVAFANRILTSDLANPNSLVNAVSDDRYRAFANAFSFKEPESARVYPAGFAEQIVQNYMDRQFEISIGNVDPTMRLALSLERDLSQVMETASTKDARWFAVMASKPLRQVFETALQLPQSFGTLDIDRQLVDFKERSERFFGTDDLSAYLEPDRLEELRNRFLLQDAVRVEPLAQQPSAALSLLGGL
ncbi:DUF1217 domain-containing protein [Cognatishimia sp. F0-27]|uniref:DUF1217 domain-containing protein n=1 Tax=Cognatishimia sp. F0-27 TaxID=2816855 RepID=UPI001D0C1C5C|nr:DUF1217 domain-containing protein [Cognatishimia sp. F0-27]MCC1492229.1 DUF1217 domain-containing protein [Cognatishimia sp. F0-27]